ncbi:MAG: 4Fe-4S dicluster domain-containing protein [Anaerolineales bacterium]|nr:4Fe-4S dicluster domain-containing protein [Anaerolineales bacterium]
MEPDTEAYLEYYARRPENLRIDETIRKLPGLLSPEAKEADTLGFASALGSFDLCEDLGAFVEANTGVEKVALDPGRASRFLKELARYYGALDVGITRLEPYHIYSILGRKERRGKAGRLSHSFALAFTVEMNRRFIAAAPAVPVVMESSKQYANAALIALQLKNFIARLGYDARAHIDGNYHVIAPLVARDAGLGEIGRMGLLMTPSQGPRVRISIVSTDLPLIPDERVGDSSMIRFCRICKRCAENCPSRAISFSDREQLDGAYRWKINMDSCFRYWNIVGTDCGRCLAVCPYSHPNTGLHKLIRILLRRAPLLHYPFLWLETIFYGRKPVQGPLPNWIPPETG